MKSFIIIFCLVAILAIAVTKEEFDYCSIKCGNKFHVACGYKREFNKQNCYKNGELKARMVPMTPELQKLATDLHNRERNNVAGGGVYNNPHACNTVTMSWNETLALHAETLAMKCVDDHDTCRDTPAYKHSGQNIFTKFRTVDKFDYASEITRAIESWMEEAQNSTKAIIKAYDKSLDVGHFTVINRDNNSHLGCAGVVVLGKWKQFIFICNYATTNIPGARIYNYECASPAAECKTGRNPNYPNLCSKEEKVDPNSYVIIETNNEQGRGYA